MTAGLYREEVTLVLGDPLREPLRTTRKKSPSTKKFFGVAQWSTWDKTS